MPKQNMMKGRARRPFNMLVEVARIELVRLS